MPAGWDNGTSWEKKVFGKGSVGDEKRRPEQVFCYRLGGKNWWTDSGEQRETRSLANSLLGIVSGVACGLSGAGQLDSGSGRKWEVGGESLEGEDLWNLQKMGMGAEKAVTCVLLQKGWWDKLIRTGVTKGEEKTYKELHAFLMLNIVGIDSISYS